MKEQVKAFAFVVAMIDYVRNLKESAQTATKAKE